MKAGGFITLQDVADEAGVSRGTASLALRNNPLIAADTRRRVQEAARRLAYRPNPLISTLMAELKRARASRSTATIAYITSWNDLGSWRRSPFCQVFEGASARAGELGYKLEIFSSKEPGITGKRLTKILYTRNIHGLILDPLPLERTKGHLSLDWSLFASVAIGYSIPRPRLHRVGKDGFLNMLLALRALRRLGYRRIGLAIQRYADDRVEGRYGAAYLSYHHRFGMKKTVPMLLRDVMDERSLVAWYRKHRPDAIVIDDQRVTGWLSRAGLDMPGDVGVVHINLPPGSKTLAGVDSNPFLAGAVAVELAEAQLHRNERGIPAEPRLVLVEGRWRDGPSVRSK